MLDEPLPRAKAKLSAEIIAAIRRYEPRARVTGISFSGDGMEGRLIPTVRVYVDVE
jgi:phage baseplate assembly protein W